MRDRRPVWAMPEDVPGRIQRTLGPEWRVVAPDEPADGSGDGQSTLTPGVTAALADAEVYLGFGIPEAVLQAAPRLRWVHSGAAGVGGSLTPEMRRRNVRFTNSAGIHGPPMAETVVGMALYFARGFDLARRGHREQRWTAERFLAADSPVRELAGAHAVIVGYGGIGREVASRLAALGMRVTGVRRRAPQKEEGVEHVVGVDALPAVLPTADLLVVTVPETAETRGLLDAPALSLLPTHAVLVNVSRGSVVDQDALEEALRAGVLRGAGLDVVREEPLPDGHPLWSLPNVLVTPHVSAVGTRFWDRQAALIEENVRRYLAGEPLLNEVDKEAGY